MEVARSDQREKNCQRSSSHGWRLSITQSGRLLARPDLHTHTHIATHPRVHTYTHMHTQGPDAKLSDVLISYLHRSRKPEENPFVEQLYK